MSPIFKIFHRQDEYHARFQAAPLISITRCNLKPYQLTSIKQLIFQQLSFDRFIVDLRRPSVESLVSMVFKKSIIRYILKLIKALISLQVWDRKYP